MFRFSSKNLEGRERVLQRFFEILPGFSSWSILLGMTALSFFRPLETALIIIAFDLYWLLRVSYSTIFLVASYWRLAAEKKTDWLARLNGMPLDQIFHLVIVPVAKETAEVVEPGIQSLAKQRFPQDRILLVLALEARAPENVKRDVAVLREKYRSTFLDFLVVEHPDGVPGEARVKGANATHAAKAAAAYFRSKGIDFENIVASCFDADTVVGQDYFACLTWHFLSCPHRTRASFQPIPVYNNNIWEAPGFARILEMGSSFFQLMESTNEKRLVTFSSHSMSFKALVDVGYWPVDMISDDSAIFWKAYLYFGGNYRVIPMYVTLSMDVAAADTWWRTIRNVYRQKQRWAWGVENFPIVMRGFLSDRRIAFSDKLKHGFKLFENHVAWSTWAFLLTFIGWLPAFFAGGEFSNSVLYYSAPRVTGIIFHLAFLSLLATMVIGLYLLPDDKRLRHPILKRVCFIVEWLLLPFIATFLSALPALHTQTRFMFGKNMEFWVTEKGRNKLRPYNR